MASFFGVRKECKMDTSKTINIANLERENFEEKFLSKAEFRNFLDVLAKTDKHIKVPANMLKVSATNSKTPTELVSATHLLLKVNGTEHPLLDTAIPSVLRRTDMDPARFKKIVDDGKFNLAAGELNIGFDLQKEKTEIQVFLRGDGKTKSALALHTNRYVSFPMYDVFAYVDDYLTNNFDSVGFVKGDYNHNLTKAEYKIEDEALCEAYKKELAKARIKGDDMYIRLMLYMSDTGFSSITLTMEMCFAGKSAFPFCEPVMIKHRDNAEMADVRDEVDKLFALVKNAVANLNRMMNIKIQHPVKVAQEIQDKYKLPKILVDDILPQLQTYEDFGMEVTAHDLYRILCTITATAGFLSYVDKHQLEVKNKLAKVAFLTDREIAKYDGRR